MSVVTENTDTMGIVADVNLLYDGDRQYIEIIMDKYPSLISYHGTGSYIKIGYFGKSDADLKYQDEVHGSLIEQIDKTVDLVYTKYLKALIYYDGIQRIEQFMFPQEGFREIFLNAVVHKDYSACNPIRISVYEDKIYIWNDGEMPPDLNSTEI